MCGIVVGFNPESLSLEALESLVAVLAHRGPDAHGLFVDPHHGVWLGHRRLSILDVSSSANQPMTSACGRYILVYNGEVYNFAELRDRLPGRTWRTGSDSEVILELIAAFGPSCLRWFNGMFALACYDRQSQTTLLARDAVGIKPLFLGRQGASWCAASELKAIQLWAQESQIGLTLDREAIAQFLHVGFIPHPATVFREVMKFPAGHYMEWTLAGPGPTIPFLEWSSQMSPRVLRDESEALTQYGQLLRGAVRRQLVSDVPIGTFLSGGIDSSLVTAVAAEEKSDLQSFTIAFEEKGFDESRYAQEVARHLGVQHHCWRVGVSDLGDWLSRWIRVYDEPLGDSSVFPTLLVSELSRRHVTVALSGDGGDETFLGYGTYSWARRIQSWWAPWLTRGWSWIPKRILDTRFNKARRILGGCLLPREQRAAHLFSQEQMMFSGQEIVRLLGPPESRHWVQAPLQNARLARPEEEQSWWDLHFYLQDDLLVKVDRASMAHSLEVRVPLLDNQLIDFSLNLSAQLKLHPRLGSKYLMKQELFRRLPQGLFDRPKRGFAIPLVHWLRRDFRPLLSKYLNQDVVRKWGVVAWPVAQAYLGRFLQGQDFHYHRVWLLLVLHWWLEENHLPPRLKG